MKKCAVCDLEYAEAYDACPACARSTQAVASTVPRSGSLFGALGAFLGYFLLLGVMTGLSNSPVLGVGIALFVFAAIVTADAFNLKEANPDRKVTGMAGSHPLVWGLGVVLIAGIAVPLYFYQRPIIKASFSAVEGVPEFMNTPQSKQGIRPGFVIGLIIVLVVVGAIFILGNMPMSSFVGGSGSTYTANQFSQVQNGMSPDEVFAVMDGAGTLTVDQEIAGMTGQIYQWKNPDGSNMSVQFQDGLVVQKAQYGLK